MTVFTDDDLKRLRQRLMLDRAVAQRNNYPTEEIDLLEDLTIRLEAAENVFADAKRLKYDDGYLMYDLNFSSDDVAKRMEVWRAAAGKHD